MEVKDKNTLVEYSSVDKNEDGVEMTELDSNSDTPKKSRRRSVMQTIIQPVQHVLGYDDDDNSSTGSTKWSFAMRRWGENAEGPLNMDQLAVTLWPWYRVFMISIGVGCAEFIPVLSLAWLVEKRLTILEDTYNLHGLGPYIGMNVALAFGLTGVSVLMIVYIATLAGGSGIPGIISYLSNGYIPHKELLSFRTVLVKVVTIVLTIGGGTVVGREGPAIHIGTGTADILFRTIDHHAPKSLKLVRPSETGDIFDGESAHEVAIVGASAGFATAFGAPMGGMLYVWEEISTHWDNLRHTSLGARCFLGVVLSTMVLRGLVALTSDNFSVKFNSIVITDDNFYAEEAWDYSDILPILILATVCGIMAGYGTIAAEYVHHFNKKTDLMKNNLAKILYAILVACGTVVIFSVVPLALKHCRQTPSDGYGDYAGDDHRRLGGGSAVRNYVQYNCADGYYNQLASLSLNGPEAVLRFMMARDDDSIYIVDLCIFLLMYFPLSLLPYGSSVPAGSFVPNLLIGASAGRIAGEIVYLIKDTTKPGVYAVIGAAAMLGGWTRTMMAIVVTMSEITGDVSLTIPITVATLIARQVAALISHHSFTHSQVDHLEDEDHIMIPSKWFDSRDKKRRKSFAEASEKKKSINAAAIEAAAAANLDSETDTKTDTNTGLSTTALLFAADLDSNAEQTPRSGRKSVGFEGDKRPQDSLNTDMAVLDLNDCSPRGEGKGEESEGGESSRRSSGLLDRIRKSSLRNSASDIGFKTNMEVKTRKSTRPVNEIEDDLT